VRPRGHYLMATTKARKHEPVSLVSNNSLPEAVSKVITEEVLYWRTRHAEATGCRVHVLVVSAPTDNRADFNREVQTAVEEIRQYGSVEGFTRDYLFNDPQGWDKFTLK
jgi:RPA family protein